MLVTIVFVADIYQFEENKETKQSTPLKVSLLEHQRGTACYPFVTANEKTNQNCLINPESPTVTLESSYSNLGIEKVQAFSSSEDPSIFLADLALDDIDQPLNDEEQSTNEKTTVPSKENERLLTNNETDARFRKSLRGAEEIMKENSWLSFRSRSLQSETNYIEENSDTVELPRCADTLVNQAGTTTCQLNSPLSLCSYEHDTMLLQNHSESVSEKKEKLKTDEYNEDSISNVSDFPSSEDLEVFLANFESSFSRNEASRFSSLNKSTEFTNSKDSLKKNDELNNKFHGCSHQDRIYTVPTGVNINTNQAMPLSQSTCKSKSAGLKSRDTGITFIRKRPFERNDIFTVDDSVSDEYHVQHLQCGGKTVFSNEKHCIKSNQ